MPLDCKLFASEARVCGCHIATTPRLYFGLHVESDIPICLAISMRDNSSRLCAVGVGAAREEGGVIFACKVVTLALDTSSAAVKCRKTGPRTEASGRDAADAKEGCRNGEKNVSRELHFCDGLFYTSVYCYLR